MNNLQGATSFSTSTFSVLCKRLEVPGIGGPLGWVGLWLQLVKVFPHRHAQGVTKSKTFLEDVLGPGGLSHG